MGLPRAMMGGTACPVAFRRTQALPMPPHDHDPEPTELTELLGNLGGEAGDDGELLRVVYDRLMEVAVKLFRKERANHTLQPTALVHEAWVKLSNENDVVWKNRSQFFAVGATVMRRILVDHARTKGRVKRGQGADQVPLDVNIEVPNEQDVDVLDVDSALAKLAIIDPRQAQIIELRFFSGLTVAEVAQCLETSTRTVEAEWTVAKAWLKRELVR